MHDYWSGASPVLPLAWVVSWQRTRMTGRGRGWLVKLCDYTIYKLFTILIDCPFGFYSTASESAIKDLRSKTERYLQRAEQIKKIVKSGGGKYKYNSIEKATPLLIFINYLLSLSHNIDPSGKVRYINISAGATGFGYDKVFKDCLDAGGIEWVAVQDPYIRARHQVSIVHTVEPPLKEVSIDSKCKFHGTHLTCD